MNFASLSLFTQFSLFFISSLISSLGIFHIGKYLFERFGLLDNPAPYGHKRKPVPLGIGSIFYVNFLVLSLFLYPLLSELNQHRLFIVLVLGAVVTCISFIDDLDTIHKFDRENKGNIKKTAEELGNMRRNTPFFVPAKVRLMMQIGVGAIIGITSIKIGYISNIFGGVLYLDQYYIVLGDLQIYLIPLIFTIVWYVVVFNSVNWSDGVPGLTSGLSFVTLLVMAVLTLKLYLVDPTSPSQVNSTFVLLCLAIFIPSVFIGWLYSMKPLVLLGESGTMFIAFMIATLAIIAGGKIATVATVLGVYLIDAFYVILMRLYNKKNPLAGDRIHHLHYRLLNMGMSENFVRYFVYSLAFLFGMAAIFLDKVGKAILFFVLIIIVVFITKILSLKK
ncbi:MAG: MraY family glycosyltransferase [Candidatus Gracilibacteria bacterium]|nr:MraY family glycosyltransferase [Candidatus Gracilibacteria bacterium]